jgi:hypothetical protein
VSFFDTSSWQDKNPLGFVNWQRGEHEMSQRNIHIRRANQFRAFLRAILPGALLTKTGTSVPVFVIDITK